MRAQTERSHPDWGCVPTWRPGPPSSCITVTVLRSEAALLVAAFQAAPLLQGYMACSFCVSKCQRHVENPLAPIQDLLLDVFRINKNKLNQK